MHHWHNTWIGSDRLLARRVARPVARFLRIEAASGLLLLAGGLAALVWANSPFSGSYYSLLETALRIQVGSFTVELTVHEFVNQALMALFFFVAGVEIKRELVVGDLQDRRTAALPVIGAMGGMIVPITIYATLNGGGPGSRGWGVPMATDIAFAVGIVSLLGPRIPAQLKLFLLSLAVADDLGAIAVIAVAYSREVRFSWLAAACAIFLAVGILRRAHVWYKPIYVALGLAAWYCMLRSGIHATVAGVAMGFLTPVAPLKPALDSTETADLLTGRDRITAHALRSATFHLRETVPVGERLVDALLPWTSFFVIPVFALANAGVQFSGSEVGTALTSRITLGTALGLVVGKTVGVCGGCYLAVKLGVGKLPRGASFLHMLGISMAAGIEFTVALFVTALAFTDRLQQDQAKIGVFIAVVSASALSLVTLRAAARRATPEELELEREEDRDLFAELP